MSNVLGIFAKWPQPGLVKTRLAAETSAAFASQVAEAMLRDTLDRLALVAAQPWLVYAPQHAKEPMTAFTAGRYQLMPQGDGDFGERLYRFFQKQLRAGAERIVVVGADSPTLPTTHVAMAFERLGFADVVLGPATDGGYYLLGCARRLPPIFTAMAWGSGTILRDTIARLDPETRLALLPPWYDVDTLDDWQMLQGHIVALRKAGHDPGVPHTEQVA
jgi:rSAM/selenodomain-associated transferase 1